MEFMKEMSMRDAVTLPELKFSNVFSKQSQMSLENMRNHVHTVILINIPVVYFAFYFNILSVLLRTYISFSSHTRQLSDRS